MQKEMKMPRRKQPAPLERPPIDPAMREVIRAIHTSGLSISYIVNRSGVAYSTIRKWETGQTKRPQHQTLEFVLRACGKQFAVVDYRSNQ